MAQQIINIGTSPNDGSGDPLRVAFQKINDNFSQLYSSGFITYQSTTFDNAANQVIFEVPANAFTQGTFQINSADPATNDSQNITINASIQNDNLSVKWTGHGALVLNNPVTQYDMDVDSLSGNVRLMVSPLVDSTLNHLISAQVEVATFILGTPMSLENGSGLLGTENNLVLTTETPA